MLLQVSVTAINLPAHRVAPHQRLHMVSSGSGAAMRYMASTLGGRSTSTAAQPRLCALQRAARQPAARRQMVCVVRAQQQGSASKDELLEVAQRAARKATQVPVSIWLLVFWTYLSLERWNPCAVTRCCHQAAACRHGLRCDTQIILAAVDKPRTISFKGAADLVTETDKNSEEAIIEVPFGAFRAAHMHATMSTNGSMPPPMYRSNYSAYGCAQLSSACGSVHSSKRPQRQSP